MAKKIFSYQKTDLVVSISADTLEKICIILQRRMLLLLTIGMSVLSIVFFIYFYVNKLGLAYNDARSHLDIARRVVEGLKPGVAQLGSVWLPLPHILMIPTVWNDFLWHTGLSGAIVSMVTFVLTGVFIFLILKELSAGMFARVVAVLLFAVNINILYLQSTAMTELLLLCTMTASVYYLLKWAKHRSLPYLVACAFWIMLSTLVRYDGWFLFLASLFGVGLIYFKSKGFKAAEGGMVLFATLAGFGIALWFLWNLLIFGDPLYFAFGPFSAHHQQEQIAAAGELFTEGNLLLSAKVYFYAVMYNTYTVLPLLSLVGALVLLKDKLVSFEAKIATYVLFSSLIFNIIALFLGHSVLFIAGISGNAWFNVRYGVMVLPSVVIFLGLLFDRARSFRPLLIALFIFVTIFSWRNFDAVTIDDARVGSSQKNVTEVSGWLKTHASNSSDYILISVASHDAIVFSSGLPMKRYIHEGTGKYWESATEHPDQWAHWIILRTNDMSDLTFREIHNTAGFKKYRLVEKYPFADIYELRTQYLPQLHETARIIDKP